MCFSCSPLLQRLFSCCFFSLAASIPHAIGTTLATELSSFLPLFSFLIFFVAHSLKGGGCMVLVKTGRGARTGKGTQIGDHGWLFKGNTGEDGAVDRYGHVHWMTLQNGILSRRNCKTLRAELLQLLSELPTKPPSPLLSQVFEPLLNTTTSRRVAVYHHIM